MRRWTVLAALAAAALLLAPAEATDVGELLPVELLYIYKEDGRVCVQTDTENWGIGDDLTAALTDLKATAPGNLFLETAEYLIVTKDTAELLPQLWQILRPGTEVVLGIQADAQAAAFLAAHKPGVTLNDIRSGNADLPILTRTEERYRLESTTDS